MSKTRPIAVLMALFAVALVTAPQARGQLVAEGALATNYVFRGVDQLGERAAFQPSLFLPVGKTGLDLFFWGSFGLTGRGTAQVQNMDELDGAIGYGRMVGPLLLRGGYYHVSWFRRDGWPDDFSTVHEAYGTVGVPQWFGSPALTVNYEMVETDGHDLYLLLQMQHTILRTADRELALALDAGYYDADWIAGGVSTDFNLALPMSWRMGELTLAMKPIVTYVPQREVVPEQFRFWAVTSLKGMLGH